ncbi:DUF397 domain-containing protein [Streptomyces tsukubensis]|uniref:DUF397 domain-containing protein n=1 Tax=Streptomyces tsukubensis TaxID=83656 RepID=A0A1V4ADP5_9ACTN|nr:DUF397 domain-containing protein [Streptomyces tsukubensis]OON81395.1 DUF397 domain-containing protein [Streptomyces tsukubensis]QFR95477.1 DUF397 domain-containing protein [Streptomyces tsukubensis]
MTDRLTWYKSSYSDDQGGACLEVALAWYKSSYSDAQGSNCVEVAAAPTHVHVRDSKRTDGPTFAVAAEAWTSFVTHTGNH